VSLEVLYVVAAILVFILVVTIGLIVRLWPREDDEE
jgi:hypothetical protein